MTHNQTIRFALPLVFALVTQVAVHAEEGRESPPGQAGGSFPAAKPADSASADELARTARRLREGIFLVFNSKGHLGTGFVVSRMHRLVATNAHVADMARADGQLFAMRNGTDVVYEVTKVWYHPGVCRKTNTGLVVRSTNVADGGVFVLGPDVAVLQLSDDGPDLPMEMELADPQELDDLFALPVGLLGFPGYDQDRPPGPGRRAIATYRSGVINRQTDFEMDPAADAKAMQFLQHNLQGLGGTSGSPLFLANGHVVALNNAGGTREDRGSRVLVNYAVRVDALWELLVYHGLDDKVRVKPGRTGVSVSRYLLPDARRVKVQRVVENVNEAEQLLLNHDWAAAAEKCTEAIREAPNYARAYKVRAQIFADYETHEYGRGAIGLDVRLEMLEKATADAETCAKLDNSPLSWCNYALQLTNYGHSLNAGRSAEAKDYSRSREAIAIAEKLLAFDDLGPQIRAEAFNVRSTARWHLGDINGALADLNRAVAITPCETFYRNRARIWRSMNYFDQALADEREADAMHEAAPAKTSVANK
jgi:tetratricopeptide (TPR) repeat protein